MFTIIFTVINAVLTAISVTSTIISIRYVKKQTEIMEKQLEASLKPNYAIPGRLGAIANAIQRLDIHINSNNNSNDCKEE